MSLETNLIVNITVWQTNAKPLLMEFTETKRSVVGGQDKIPVYQISKF